MTVSSASQDAVPHAFGLTYLTFMTTLPPEVVLGAFTGSIVFLLGVSHKPKWQWMLYFTIAFMAGLLGSVPVADITRGALALIGIHVTIPLGMGAMASAACTINVITWLRDNAARVASKRLGADKGDIA